MESLTRTAGIDYLAEFALAAEWFGDRVARSVARTPVVTCPGWTVLDLTRHLGNVHAWAASVVETGGPTPAMQDDPPSPRPRHLAAWYLAKAEDLYRVLVEAEPTASCWNFATGTGPVAFWVRRTLHETLMHGVDLAETRRLAEHFPAPLAVDGIDEVLTVMRPLMAARGHHPHPTHPLVVRETLGGRTWAVTPPGELPAQARTERPAADLRDADRLEGPPAVLVKALWKRLRPPHPDLVMVGDEGRVRAFLETRLTP